MVMDVVTSLPLLKLSHHSDEVSLHRREGVRIYDITQLLRFASGVEMVVAAAGHPLRWLAGQEMLAFWADEARRRTRRAGDIVFSLAPDRHVYFASRWSDDKDRYTVIVLEQVHGEPCRHGSASYLSDDLEHVFGGEDLA